MSKLKVYGGNTHARGKQVRVIVATTSLARAAEAVGVSPYYARTYWCETGNEQEVAAALAQPGTPLYCTTGVDLRAETRYEPQHWPQY